MAVSLPVRSCRETRCAFCRGLPSTRDALDQDSLEARVLVVVLPQPGTARLRPTSCRRRAAKERRLLPVKRRSEVRIPSAPPGSPRERWWVPPAKMTARLLKGTLGPVQGRRWTTLGCRWHSRTAPAGADVMTRARRRAPTGSSARARGRALPARLDLRRRSRPFSAPPNGRRRAAQSRGSAR